MRRPWMPLYVADYLANTGRLSAAEHGAYLLLIMQYWTGRLPDDDTQLARIAWITAADGVGTITIQRSSRKVGGTPGSTPN